MDTAAEEEIKEQLLIDIDLPSPPPAQPGAVKMSVRSLCKASEVTSEPILRGASLELPVGWVVGIIGPSGSGKSTLLRALNRLWEPPAGTVLLDGADIRCLDVLALRRRVGMLFQLPTLFEGIEYDLKVLGRTRLSTEIRDGGCVLSFVMDLNLVSTETATAQPVEVVSRPRCRLAQKRPNPHNLKGPTGTVADNVRYGPQLRGKKLTDFEVGNLLKMADLDAALSSKPASNLSVGQAQRVALARTLANNPEVLLLDEPTSALDPISTQNIEEAIVRLKRTQGMTVVIVSHSVKQVQRIADVVCLLVAGEIVEVLPPSQLSQAQHPMARRFLELSG